jgi:hypothetical protein
MISLQGAENHGCQTAIFDDEHEDPIAKPKTQLWCFFGKS